MELEVIDERVGADIEKFQEHGNVVNGDYVVELEVQK